MPQPSSPAAILLAGLGEDAVAIVQVQVVAADVVGNKQILVAVVVDVGEAGAETPVGIVDAGCRSAFGEGAVAVVDEQLVRLTGRVAAVDDIEIDVAVVVDIGPDAHPAPGLVTNAGGVGHIGEGAVAVVGKEHVLGADAVVGAVEVEIAVVVVIGKGRRVGERLEADAGLSSHIGEGAVAIIGEQAVGFDLILAAGGQVKVDVAVVVVIAEHAAHGETGRIDTGTGGRGDVLEGAVTIIQVKLVAAPFIRHIQVDEAVVVDIGKGDTLAQTVISDARLLGNVNKLLTEGRTSRQSQQCNACQPNTCLFTHGFLLFTDITIVNHIPETIPPAMSARSSSVKNSSNIAKFRNKSTRLTTRSLALTPVRETT